MRIRGCRDNDFDALALLYREFFNEMREWQGLEQLKLDEEGAAETARESLGMISWVFVAEDSGELVGFARVQFWDGGYFVREIFVTEAFRRRSLGSRLLTKCEDLVKKRGETSTYLSVEPGHSVSLKFLAHNGYDTLNTLELRKDFDQAGFIERRDKATILGQQLRLLKRKKQR
ncbi:MAG TPA: GNAT family N-acetyltransferase [Candidatus Paceibacterota bacterium]|nr:GNAT family N-acetyltransferase [Candidatus Paceibacterota bacterium]